MAKFILSKTILKEQVKKLEDAKIRISYSYKTNRVVGKVLQEMEEARNVNFSIHAKEEIEEIREKDKIWFFTQAESEQELKKILEQGIRSFVVDNEVDFERLLEVAEELYIVINLSLRMKFQEHRIGTGKYFVYGMPSLKVNELLSKIRDNKIVNRLGVHFHRKSQNTSEWDMLEEIKDSLNEENIKRIDFVNIGGGLPSFYRSSSVDNFKYIFQKIEELKKWLCERNIELIIEPGRFLAAPCINLEAEIIQKYDNCLILDTTIYNCAVDTILTGTKLLVEGELSENEEGEFFLIKGNSPTRDDIFRYKVKLRKDIKVGDKIVFLNAGAYNYTTDFFGYKKLDTEIKENP